MERLGRLLPVAAVMTLLFICVLAMPVNAEDYRDAAKNFKRVFKNPASTSYQRADAIKRLARAATGRDVKKALKEIFNVLKDKVLHNDRQIQTWEAERERLSVERDKIMDVVRGRGNRITQAEQESLTKIEARSAELGDLLQSNNIAKNAAVDAIAGMTDPEARAEILDNITNRDANIASACIDAARRARWGDAYDKVAEAFEDSRDAGVRALCIATLKSLNAKRAINIFKTAINDGHYMVRSHAVAGLRASRDEGAIDALIGRLAIETPGRLKWDIVYALQDLTGKTEFGEEATTWSAWWNAAKRKGDFRVAPASNPGQARSGDGSGGDQRLGDNKTGTFYGIPIRTKNPVFVIDRSGSMLTAANGQVQMNAQGQPQPAPPGTKSKWQACQEELFKAIDGLPEDSTFAIVWYSTEVSAFQDGRVLDATDRNKKQAQQTIQAMNADGLTNIYEAMQRGFEICTGGKMDGARPLITGRREEVLNGDTIFFLTDGSPTCGPSVNGIAPTNPPNAQYSPALLEEICKWNETRNLVIHTVCIGQGDEGFLRGLADRNRGTFRKVNGQ